MDELIKELDEKISYLMELNDNDEMACFSTNLRTSAFIDGLRVAKHIACKHQIVNKQEQKQTKIPFKFEKMMHTTWRIKVINGWIVSFDNDRHQESYVFVPDEFHEWEIE